MQLLINADDFGCSESVNYAVDYCFKNQLIQRTSIMVNMEYFDEAVVLAKEGGYDDKVGLHLNLTEGRPLTELIKHTDFCSNGVFNGNAIRKQKNRFFLNKRVKKAVRCEIEAQIEKYIAQGFNLLHIDSHQHVHTNPSIFYILLPLIKKYQFRTMRLSRNIPKHDIGWIKRIYKDLFNRKVFGLTTQKDEGKLVKYFGTQDDVDKILKDSHYKTEQIEVETHPIFKNGQLKDAIYTIGVGEWVSNLKVKNDSNDIIREY